MTGPAERPSRKPLETRTAATAHTIETHYTRISARAGLRHLGAAHAAARKQLLAAQAAGYAALRSKGSGAALAVARARAEIAQTFAHRWAEIRRAPPALRAAAAAALESEQAAALAARIRALLDQAHHHRAVEHTQLRHLFAAQRKALSRQLRNAPPPIVSSAPTRRGRAAPSKPVKPTRPML